tara:strand:- start:5826 stop:6155 length:330 start_codon:yes stop_codon:yes gene_type:complete
MTRPIQFLLASLTLMFILPLAAAEPVPDVRMSVYGLACPFCVNGVEKRLKKVPNVKSVRADLKTGTFVLILEPKQVDLANLRQAVKKAGFTAGKIEVAPGVKTTGGRES